MLAKMTNYAQKFYHKLMELILTSISCTIHCHCVDNDSACNVSDNSDQN